MDLLDNPALTELGMVLAVSTLLVLYYWLFDHGFLGSQALRSFNQQSRQHWVAAILTHSGNEILAVQVLRNSIMSATVMASTCVLLVIATMTLVSDPDKFAAHWLGDAVTHGVWRIKVGSLLLVIFLAFWHFAQSIRIYGHVGYLLGMPKQGKSADSANLRPNYLPAPEQATALLNTAGHMFSFGNRYFFFSLALALWWFGFIYFAIGTISLTAMSWRLERRALLPSQPITPIK